MNLLDRIERFINSVKREIGYTVQDFRVVYEETPVVVVLAIFGLIAIAYFCISWAIAIDGWLP